MGGRSFCLAIGIFIMVVPIAASYCAVAQQNEDRQGNHFVLHILD
jgi:hypothetical protein